MDELLNRTNNEMYGWHQPIKALTAKKRVNTYLSIANEVLQIFPDALHNNADEKIEETEQVGNEDC